MKRKTFVKVFITVLMISLFITGCGGKQENTLTTNNSQVENTETQTNSDGGILKEATISKLGSLNPHTYTSTYQSSVIQRTSVGLYRYLPNDSMDGYILEGEIAEGRPVQKDEEGKIWEIKIKEGLKWHNGDDLDANDVMYTWQAILDPIMVNPRGGSFADDYITIVNGEKYYLQDGEEVSWEDVGLKLIDNHTLQIETVDKHSDQEIMTHFTHAAHSLVHPETYESLKTADGTETLYGTSEDKYVSSGKFYLDNWITDSIINLKKNPNYVFSDCIKLDGIETRVVQDKGTQMQLFESGQIDIIELSPEDYLKYEEDPRVLYQPSSSVISLTFNSINPEQPILANQNFRHAIYYSINRESLSKLTKTTPANYTVSTRLVIDPETGLRYRDTDLAKKNITPNLGYDPEKAKELFEKALSEEGLEKVSLNILYNDNDLYKTMTEYLQKTIPETLGEDKISLTLQAMPASQLNDAKKTFKENPTVYEITWSAWAPNELAPWNGMKYWTSSYGRNNEPWSNEEFDRLFKEANTGESRFEEGKQLEYTARMEEILLEEMPFVPVASGIDKFLISERIKLPFPEWINKLGFGWEYVEIVE